MSLHTKRVLGLIIAGVPFLANNMHAWTMNDLLAKTLSVATLGYYNGESVLERGHKRLKKRSLFCPADKNRAQLIAAKKERDKERENESTKRMHEVIDAFFFEGSSTKKNIQPHENTENKASKPSRKKRRTRLMHGYEYMVTPFVKTKS